MFVEDLGPFFNAAELAEEATLDGVAVRVILDRAYRDGLGGLVEATAPAALVPTVAVPAVAQGSVLIVVGATYVVAAVEPDGTGVTTLRLERAA